MRMTQTSNDWETAFEQEKKLERHRRYQLRKRAVSRSKARTITKVETRGRNRFGVLVLALGATVVIVTVVMFETLAWLMG